MVRIFSSQACFHLPPHNSNAVSLKSALLSVQSFPFGGGRTGILIHRCSSPCSKRIGITSSDKSALPSVMSFEVHEVHGQICIFRSRDNGQVMKNSCTFLSCISQEHACYLLNCLFQLCYRRRRLNSRTFVSVYEIAVDMVVPTSIQFRNLLLIGCVADF